MRKLRLGDAVSKWADSGVQQVVVAFRVLALQVARTGKKMELEEDHISSC